MRISWRWELGHNCVYANLFLFFVRKLSRHEWMNIDSSKSNGLDAVPCMNIYIYIYNKNNKKRKKNSSHKLNDRKDGCLTKVCRQTHTKPEIWFHNKIFSAFCERIEWWSSASVPENLYFVIYWMLLHMDGWCWTNWIERIREEKKQNNTESNLIVIVAVGHTIHNSWSLKRRYVRFSIICRVCVCVYV